MDCQVFYYRHLFVYVNEVPNLKFGIMSRFSIVFFLIAVCNMSNL